MAKYVDILFRHRLRFLLLFFVLPVELASACIFLFPHQNAVSSLWVDSPAYFGISPAATGWNQYLTPAQNTQDAMAQLTETAAFAHTLAVDLDQMGTFRGRSERDSVFSTFAADLHISAAGSHLVVLTFTCPRAQICIDVLATTVVIYRNWLADQTAQQASVALDFYTGQLADAQAQYNTDSALLTQYVSAHPGLKPSEAVLNQDYAQLLKNVNQDQAQVTALKNKIDSINLTQAAARKIDDTVLKTIDPPRVVGGGLSSLPRKQMLIAGLAGLTVAVVFLVAMAWLDRTVREPEELERRLKLPVISTIADLASGREAVA